MTLEPEPSDYYADYQGPQAPVQVLDRSLEEDTAITVTLRATDQLSPTERRSIVRALEAWYADGVQDLVPGAGLSYLSGPEWPATSSPRWVVDGRFEDPHAALGDLARRIGGWATKHGTAVVVVVGQPPDDD